MAKRKLRKQIAITMLSTAFIVTPILNDTYLSSPFTLSVYAESSEASSLDWTLENGILTISGTGKMATSSLSIPWSDRLNEIHSVVIEDGITNVGSFAFRNCSKLVSITLPESIKTIEKNAFKNCISLYSIEFPVGINVIERGAFSGCTALQEVVFPNTLDSIDQSAFEGCTSLKKAVIPDSVSTIGDYAFESCNEQFVMCCAFGSSAYSYAKANGLKYDDSYTFEHRADDPSDPIVDDPSNPIIDDTSDPIVDDPSNPIVEENDIIIYKASDLQKLSLLGNINENIYLQSDIKAPADWKPISEFNGNFYGNGHTISGISDCFIGTIGSNSVIKDLTLADASIKSDVSGSIGAFAAVNQGTIDNCKVTGEISLYSTLSMSCNIPWMEASYFPSTFSRFCVGGIAGINKGNITNCTNNAKVSAINSSDNEDDHGVYYACAGGIAGENSGIISKCKNIGYVSSRVYTYSVPSINSNSRQHTQEGYTVAVSGGISGFSTGPISGCHSVGAHASDSNYYSGKSYLNNISDEEAAALFTADVRSYAGGIVGAVYNTSITQCSSAEAGELLDGVSVSLSVEGNKYVENRLAQGWCGGIAGASYGYVTISECSNKIDPWVSVSENGQLNKMSERLFCGGIVGAAFYSNTVIENCYNIGSPTTSYDFDNGGTVTKIDGGFFHGGLVGAVNNSVIAENNSFVTNKGSVSLRNCFSIAPAKKWKDSATYIENNALINETLKLSYVTANGSFNNCYYPDNLTGSYGTAKSEADMKSEAFVQFLGDTYIYIPDSYPMLNWEKKDVRGDVNADGEFTIADVLTLQKWLLADPTAEMKNWKAADLCEDNILNVFDLVLLKQELINNM